MVDPAAPGVDEDQLRGGFAGFDGRFVFGEPDGEDRRFVGAEGEVADRADGHGGDRPPGLGRPEHDRLLHERVGGEQVAAWDQHDVGDEARFLGRHRPDRERQALQRASAARVPDEDDRFAGRVLAARRDEFPVGRDVVDVQPEFPFRVRPPVGVGLVVADVGIGHLDAVFGAVPGPDLEEVFDVVGVPAGGEHQASSGREGDDGAFGSFGELQPRARRAEQGDGPARVERDQAARAGVQAEDRPSTGPRPPVELEVLAGAFGFAHPEVFFGIEADAGYRRPAFEARDRGGVFERQEARFRSGRELAVGILGDRGDPAQRDAGFDQRRGPHVPEVEAEDRARFVGEEELSAWIEAFPVEAGRGQPARGQPGRRFAQREAPPRPASERVEAFEPAVAAHDQYLRGVFGERQGERRAMARGGREGMDLGVVGIAHVDQDERARGIRAHGQGQAASFGDRDERVGRADLPDQGAGRRPPHPQHVVGAGGEDQVFEADRRGHPLRSRFDHPFDPAAGDGDFEHRQFAGGRLVQAVAGQGQPGGAAGAFGGEARGGDGRALGGVFGGARAAAPAGREEGKAGRRQAEPEGRARGAGAAPHPPSPSSSVSLWRRAASERPTRERASSLSVSVSSVRASATAE